MMRLKKGRQFPIPGGFRFALQLGPGKVWKSAPWQTFDSIVRQAQGVIRANPTVAAQNKWPIHEADIATWIEDYNARICASAGLTDYIDTGGGAGVPKRTAAQQAELQRGLAAAAAKIRQIADGYKAIREWKSSGDPAVPAEESAARAATCAACPQNQAGDWTEWFTRPAAELIRRDIEHIEERKLSTPDDAKLNVCQACFCPLRLKVHIPLPYILPAVTPSIEAALRGGLNCWIVRALDAAAAPTP